MEFAGALDATFIGSNFFRILLMSRGRRSRATGLGEEQDHTVPVLRDEGHDVYPPAKRIKTAASSSTSVAASPGNTSDRVPDAPPGLTVPWSHDVPAYDHLHGHGNPRAATGMHIDFLGDPAGSDESGHE